MAKDKVGKRARDFLKTCIDDDNGERQLKLDDLKFGIKGDQWDSDTQTLRKGRLMLTINKLPQFVKQVCNEQRQNSPQMKVIPAGLRSSTEGARLFGALIKNIEAQSVAKEAYSTAFYYAVCTGEGYFRIVTNYSSDDTFDQDIRIEKINNPFSVYLGPHQRVDGSDAKKALISELITKYEYKERYGKEYKGSAIEVGYGDEDLNWTEEEKVRIAEYWEITEVEKEISLLTDGSTVCLDEASEEELMSYQSSGVSVKKTRKVMAPKVTQYIVDGTDVPIETNDWAGKYIPIVKVTGDEVWIEGKRFTSGLIRPAKDPQKMYNYWRTNSTELVALAPKAPYMLTPKQIENHQGMWDKANVEARPYLLYNESNAGMPQRIQYANSPVGAVSEALGANDDMKQVTGINDASKGLKSNETSGRAITARKAQGDIANFNYIDNMAQSVAYGCRILIDLIPKIYDAERVIKVNTPEGKTEMVAVNVETVDPLSGVNKILNDLSVGEYDVEATVGPNYATQRQEAVDNMTQLIQYSPEVGPLVFDLIAEMMDSPISEQVSARLKKMLPPNLQEGGQQIPPEIQQQMQEHQQIIEQQGQELQKLQQDQSLKQAEFMQKQELSQSEMQFKVAEMNQQFELEVEQMNRKHELAQQEMEQKYNLKKYEADLDAHCKMEAGKETGKENGEPNEAQKSINVIDSSAAGPLEFLARSVQEVARSVENTSQQTASMLSQPKNKTISMVGPSGKTYTGTVTEQ